MKAKDMQAAHERHIRRAKKLGKLLAAAPKKPKRYASDADAYLAALHKYRTLN
jgi:hypothetical protein